MTFGEVGSHFTRRGTGDFEAELFGQARRGGTKLELTVAFQRADRGPARAGLIQMAGDDNGAIKRLVVSDRSFFAIVGLFLDLDVRRAWILFGDPTMPMR